MPRRSVVFAIAADDIEEKLADGHPGIP